jgi:hypothetical protein
MTRSRSNSDAGKEYNEYKIACVEDMAKEFLPSTYNTESAEHIMGEQCKETCVFVANIMERLLIYLILPVWVS